MVLFISPPYDRKSRFSVNAWLAGPVAAQCTIVGFVEIASDDHGGVNVDVEIPGSQIRLQWFSSCRRTRDLPLHSDTAAAYTKPRAAMSDSHAPAMLAKKTMFSGAVLPRVRPLCPVMAASGIETQKKYDEAMRLPAMNHETVAGTEKNDSTAATENIRIAAIGRL